jgi:hypothetical protein
MWMPGWEAHTASRGLDGVILRGGIMTDKGIVNRARMLSTPEAR